MTSYAINPSQTVGEFLPTVYISKITLRSDAGYTKNEINPHIDYPGEGNITRGDGSLQVEVALTLKDVLGAGGTSQWFAAGALPNGRSLKDYIKVNVVQAYTGDSVRLWSHKMGSNDLTYDPSGELSPGAGTSFISLSLEEFGDEKDLERYITEFDKNGNSIKNISHSILSSDPRWKPGSAGQSTDLPSDPVDLAYFVWTSLNLDLLAEDFQFNNDNVLRPTSGTWGSPLASKINSDVVYRNQKMVTEGYVFFEATRTPGGLVKTDTLWTGAVHYHNGTSGDYEGFMGGKTHDPNTNQPYLLRVTVPNQKIEDFRVVARLDKLELNFSVLQNEIYQALTKSRRTIMDDKMRFSYFTDINLSRDQNNNCRFMFGLDLRKIVRENTPYSNLFAVPAQDNPAWFQEVMRKVRILSLKVYRKRIQGSSETGTTPYYFSNNHLFEPTRQLRKFDNALARNMRDIGTPDEPKYLSYDSADELIIDAGEDQNLQFIGDGAASADGLSTMTRLQNIYNNNAVGIHYYTATDGGMSSKSDGYYQYRVELKIEDGVVEFLIEKRAELLLQLEKLKEYYNAGTKSSARFGSGAIQEATFDPTTNRFTQVFQNSAAGNSWPSEAAFKYVEILKIFTHLTRSERATIMIALKNYMRPSSGNPQGCLAVINLYDNLITFINSAIGVQKERSVSIPKDAEAKNATGNSPNTFETDVGTSGKPSSNNFVIEHTFSDYYDANLSLNTGYDFLGAAYNNIPRIQASPGLRIISDEQWQASIVPKELTKLFNSPTSRIDIPSFLATGPAFDNTLQLTDFSYLTPAVVYSGQGVSLPLIGQNTEASPNINNQNFINTATTNLTFLSNHIMNTNTLQEKVADFLSYNYNLTATPVPNPTTTIHPPGSVDSNGPSATPLQEYVLSINGQTSQNQAAFGVFWNLISNGVVSEGSRGGAGLPEGSNQKAMEYYNPQSPEGFYGALDASVSPQVTDRTALMKEKLDRLPNPVKALIRFSYENYSLTQGTTFGEGALKTEIDTFLQSEPFISPTLSSKARILFETIGQIQYLDGYGETEYSLSGEDITETSLAMPIWKTLDRLAYNRIGSGGSRKALLCRIIPWTNGIFKINRPPSNDLPTYEKFFVLNAGSAPLAESHTGLEPSEQITPPSPPDNSEETSTYFPTYSVNTNWMAEDITGGGLTTAPPESQPPPVTTAVPGATGGAFTAANAAQMQQNIQNTVAAANAAGDNSSGAPTAPTLPGAAGSTFAPASGQQSSGQQSNAPAPNPLSGLGTGGGGSYGT